MSYRLANVKVWDGTQWVKAVGYGESNIITVFDEVVLVDLFVINETETVDLYLEDTYDYLETIVIADTDLTITDTISVTLV